MTNNNNGYASGIFVRTPKIAERNTCTMFAARTLPDAGMTVTCWPAGVLVIIVWEGCCCCRFPASACIGYPSLAVPFSLKKENERGVPQYE
ncbi:hypothetical protein HW555_008487 [Spodoptera exigua]|uniref:Uncharacterized protein n=1 Tax=Spodoptera exigua TaxID=7107 RepID=A0A835L3D9_SPOEX|nr:hypothetical protein HW555_008487 [Spodoptera exigua]